MLHVTMGYEDGIPTVDITLSDFSDMSDEVKKDPELNALVKELLEIGATDGFISQEKGEKFDEEHRHIRAREIGRILYAKGGVEYTSTIILSAVWTFGKDKTRDLEKAWRQISN